VKPPARNGGDPPDVADVADAAGGAAAGGAGATARYLARGARLVEGFLRRRPIHCVVQVSNRCNLTCGFCSFWERPAPPRDEMTVADFEVISSKLAEGGSMVASLEGGEPLLRPDIVPIVRAFARHHHPVLFTNGWRVTAPLARALWDAGLVEIGVSIDYPDAARHDAHRGQPGTFEAALRALDILRHTAPRGRGQVMVMTVVMDDNAAALEPLLRLSDAKGVNHQMTLISTGGRGRHDGAQGLPAPEVADLLLGLKRRYPHFVAFTGYLEGVGRFLRGEVRSPCWAGERFLNVDHLGEVSPCIEKLHLSAGNLRRDPWSVIAERLRGFEEPKRCTGCYTSCRGFVEEMSGLPRPRSYAEFFGGMVTLGAGLGRGGSS
jgi:MoaA/NifB/PqqE/SkfB family radical SAM enzyme